MSKLKIVKQEQKFGCGVACLATILECDYWKVARCFRVQLDEEGVSAQDIADFLAGYGFDIISATALYYSNGYNTISKRILKPFADIHIVGVNAFIDKSKSGDTDGHWMIMTKDGTLYDPSTGAKFDGSFLYIDVNIGIFYPESWNLRKRLEKNKKNASNSTNNRTNSHNYKSSAKK